MQPGKDARLYSISQLRYCCSVPDTRSGLGWLPDAAKREFYSNIANCGKPDQQERRMDSFDEGAILDRNAVLGGYAGAAAKRIP